MIKNVKIGADPELFLEKEGIIVSAEGLIGGTKHKPKKIDDRGYYVQEDNVMVEFNIPPSDNSKDFIYHINNVKDYLKVYFKLKGYELNYSASAILSDSELSTKQARAFGCEPDYNVYLKDCNNAPSSKIKLRCCGGHIHVGWDNPSMEDQENLVYALDVTLGLDSLILDTDSKRRSMYGKAGSFRFKDYGIEYRTLSNFWIRNDKLISWVYDRVMKAIDLVNTGEITEIVDKYSEEIQSIIDNNDIKKSIELLSIINNKTKVK